MTEIVSMLVIFPLFYSSRTNPRQWKWYESISSQTARGSAGRRRERARNGDTSINTKAGNFPLNLQLGEREQICDTRYIRRSEEGKRNTPQGFTDVT